MCKKVAYFFASVAHHLSMLDNCTVLLLLSLVVFVEKEHEKWDRKGNGCLEQVENLFGSHMKKSKELE